MAFVWLNEPPAWNGDVSRLDVTTRKNSDFWRYTFYGFVRDDGHAWLTPVAGDFSASAVVTGDYRHLYDQAGLMLRIDDRNWIKTGIEFTDGLMHFSVVVTREVSDWSVIPLPEAKASDALHVRLTRHGEAVRIQYAINEGPWQMARLAPFSAVPARIGVMACSPQRAGFQATFRDIAIGPPISRELHADSD
ncbi:MAG: DUF1349 domain-containing protein [Rhizobiaceae bacterium]